MNDLLTGFYESWFDYNLYEDLIEKVFRESGFGSLGWVIIIITIVFLAIFYKLWDPVEGQRKKWAFTLVANSLVIFIISILILYNNQGLIEAMGNFVEGQSVNPHYFVFQIAGITAFYALLLALLVCIIPSIKFISTNNKHNPF